ncbi:GNAT family N-acetyltransferase [Streptomyces niger]|uniref:GNAT family N-acetyltransferase n=1 Tax=Streptomyces niger TaxID=66373 RepID=UPI00069B519C|nr:GNAT family N-acetyltransferase [Streptomyces niger]
MPGEALVRLYDLPPFEFQAASPAVAVPPDGQDASVWSSAPLRVVHEPSAVPKGKSWVELRQGGAVFGRCAINSWGAGTVGPCEVAPDVDAGRRPQAHWTLMQLALERLRWLGYAYGLLDVQEFADQLPAAVENAVWWVPTGNTSLSAADRDDKSLEWADLFVDLRTWTPAGNAAALGVDGRSLCVRRPETSEQLLLTDWIRETFGGGWASEVHRSFSRDPISSVIIVDQDRDLPAKDRLLGFISYDTARLGMLSSIALAPSVRGHALAVASTLIEQCLSEARDSGMPYAVLGGVSHRRQALRLMGSLWTIPGSCPGIFGKGVRN